MGSARVRFNTLADMYGTFLTTLNTDVMVFLELLFKHMFSNGYFDIRFSVPVPFPSRFFGWLVQFVFVFFCQLLFQHF